MDEEERTPEEEIAYLNGQIEMLQGAIEGWRSEHDRLRTQRDRAVEEVLDACAGFERSAQIWRRTALFAEGMAKKAQARAHALEESFCCPGMPLTKHQNGAVTNTPSPEKIGEVYDKLTAAQKDTARLMHVAGMIRNVLESVKGAERFTDKTKTTRTWSIDDIHEFLGAIKYELGVTFKAIKDAESRAAIDDAMEE